MPIYLATAAASGTSLQTVQTQTPARACLVHPIKQLCRRLEREGEGEGGLCIGRKEGRKEGEGKTVCIDCLFRCSLQRISGRELPHEREGGESREIIIAMLALLPEPQFEFGTRPIIPATVVLLDSHTVARDTDATSPH